MNLFVHVMRQISPVTAFFMSMAMLVGIVLGFIGNAVIF